MPDWLNWMLGGPALRAGDEGVRLSFAYPLTAFEWAAVAVGALVVAFWSYARLDAPRAARAALATLRAALLVLIVLLITGPRLVKTDEAVERDWVLMLVDRSASMTIADAPGPAPDAEPVSRERQLRDLLERHEGVLSRLDRERIVQWYGFDAGLFDLRRAGEDGVSGASTPRAIPHLDEPAGRRTNLGAALEAALLRATARPVSGVVVFSDGRSTDLVSRATLRRMNAERIPLLVVPLGSSEPVSDLAVDSAVGPGAAFVNDVVPVQVTLRRTGSTARPSGASVRLVDPVSGRVLDERRVSWEARPEPAGADPLAPPPPRAEEPPRRITLSTTPTLPGRMRYVVEVIPDAGTGDLVRENNRADVAITLVDRPLRVLYLDGYPRWEYRFLKNILARERSMQFASLLLSLGRRYLAEGSLPVDAAPITAREWEQFDVIMIGDMRPEVLTIEQMRQIRARVSEGGAGLLWIGGPGATPWAWRSTPLADLLPMTLTSMAHGEALSGGMSGGGAGGVGGVGGVVGWNQDVVAVPAPLAASLGVLRLADVPVSRSPVESEDPSLPDMPAVQGDDPLLSWPSVLSDPTMGWPRLRYAQRIDPSALKPAAEVLALAQPADPSASPGDSTPLVLTMRFGAGRVVYVATDEIWRWRYGRGEDLPERFYLQLLRLLGRDAVARSGRPAILTATPSRAEIGQPVRVTAELLDQGLLDATPASITVSVSAVPDPVGGQVITEELVLRPTSAQASGGVGDVAVRRTFVGTWVPNITGRVTLNLTDALVAQAAGPQGVTAEVEVFLADDELRRPESDHALLAEIALQTRAAGGVVLSDRTLADLPQLLPKREVRIPGITQEHTFWDTPLALLAVLFLLTLEWVCRRLLRLS
jgi:hypothetical protein